MGCSLPTDQDKEKAEEEEEGEEEDVAAEDGGEGDAEDEEGAEDEMTTKWTTTREMNEQVRARTTEERRAESDILYIMCVQREHSDSPRRGKRHVMWPSQELTCA